MNESLDTLGDDLGPLRPDPTPPAADPPAPAADPPAPAPPAIKEDDGLGLAMDVVGPEDVLGDKAAGRLQPRTQGPGSSTETGDLEGLVGELNEGADAAQAAPLPSIEAQFAGAVGDTVAAREVWGRWQAVLDNKRQTKWADYLTRSDWKDDVAHGPRDEPGMRLLSGAFVRDAETNEILWDVYKNGILRVAMKCTPVEALEHIQFLEAAGTSVRFEPCRQSPVVDLRNAVSRRVVDPPTGTTKGAPQMEQSFRRAGGTDHSVSATRTIKAQIISIRLNAHHWEWSYSRWLENHGMFDTPSMTPYIDDAKLKAHETSAAVPLLTRGTLGFSGVALESETLYGNGGATAAIGSKDQLTREWTIERLRGLPRLSRTSNNDDNSDLLVALREKVKKLPEGENVVAAKDGGRVTLLFLDSLDEVCWSTVFAVADPRGGDGHEFYANANWFDADQAGLLRERQVRGYDSWVGGTGRAAILASTGDAQRQQRLELAYEGLPLFFGKPGLAEESECVVAGGKSTSGGGFVDVRVHDDYKWKGSVRSYSEVYRNHMFAPMPVRGVPTLPKARAKPALAANATGLWPRCLNFTLTDSDPVAASGGVVKNLKQRYPEVAMYGSTDRNSRLKYMGTLFSKKQAPKRRETYEWWTDDVETTRMTISQTGSKQVKDTPQYETLMEKLKEIPELAPVTLEGVMARYMAEHGDVLAHTYGGGLKTSPRDGLHRPGGVYYSCRIDTGTGRGEGGLDSRFPVPMDANVYEIADVNLARGVHDYIYVRPSDAPAEDEEGYTHEFTARAGPPAWWADEQARMDENLPLSERKGNDPCRFDKAVAACTGKPIASMWTDGLEASDQPTDDELSRLPTIETARSLYQHLRDVAPLDDARAHRFAASQMRRLDTAAGFPERAEAGGAPNDRAETWPLHYALTNQDFKHGSTGPLHPTALCVPTTTKAFGAAVRERLHAHAKQAVLFGTFYPVARDAQARDAQSDARTVVEALPHRHDARVPCMPIYPTRLSLNSLSSVQTMVQNLQTAQREGKNPDVVTDKDGRRVRSAARSGAKKGAKSDLETASLVVPLYVVALDYEDFKQAVQTGDAEWHAFLEAHPNYWKEKDRFRVVDDDHLEPNLDYVYPNDTRPARGEGRWETHDGPWVDDDPEVVRISNALRANVAEVRAKNATASRGESVGDGIVLELRKQQRALREQLKEAQAVAGKPLEYATRPAERMRDSWFEDRYEFGRLAAESASDPIPPAEAFKQRVVRWERMYDEWSQAVRGLDDLGALNHTIGENIAALRDASLRLCWGLGRLVSAKNAPQDLYKEDGELPLLGDAALARQRMSGDGGNGFETLRTRLTLPLFLIDVLDHLDDVGAQTRWFALQHAVVEGVATFQTPLNKTLPYLEAVRKMGTPNWPDAQRIDSIADVAGGVLRSLLAHLGDTLGATDWPDMKARIDAFLSVVASSPSPDDGDDASDANVLAREHRPTLRPLLVEWAMLIVNERTQSLFRGEDAQTRVEWTTLEEALAPLSELHTRRARASARIADLHAAAILFGLAECPRVGDDDGVAPSTTVLRYARELDLVGGLLDAQRKLVLDMQVFGNDLGGRSIKLGNEKRPLTRDYMLISYTADAFSRLFVSIQAEELVELNSQLENAMKGGDLEDTLELLMDEVKEKYSGTMSRSDNPDDVPRPFYAAISIVDAVLTLYDGQTRSKAVRAEQGAKRLLTLSKKWEGVVKSLTNAQEALANALANAGEDDPAQARWQTEMETNAAEIRRMSTMLTSLNRIVASGDQDTIDSALRTLFKKRRRDEDRPLDAADAALQRALAGNDVDPQGPSSDDVQMAETVMDGAVSPSGADAPLSDDSGAVLLQVLDKFGDEADATIASLQALLASLDDVPKAVDDDEMRDSDAMLNPGPTTTGRAVEFAKSVLDRAPPGGDEKAMVMRKEVIDSAKRDALVPHKRLAARLVEQTKAQRARLASLRQEREAADAALRRAIAAARAELLAPDALDASAREERRARLNAALGDVATSPGGELSYSDYLERLEGFGVDDPGACNDDDLGVIDKHELFGWKGEYRRYVARLLRVVDDHWSVDEAVLSPAEWLERGARFAPGPPRPSQARVDAASAADAAALRAASLSQAVEGIVGPRGGDDAARVEAALSHLLEADRRCMARVGWPWRALYAFDFDGHAPSSVVARAE